MVAKSAKEVKILFDKLNMLSANKTDNVNLEELLEK